MAFAIWSSSCFRLRSTSAWAAAGTAGSCDFTSGHEIVSAAFALPAFPLLLFPPACWVAVALEIVPGAARGVLLLDDSPAKAEPAMIAPDSTTAAELPMIATRRFLYFGRALDIGIPHSSWGLR